MCIFTQLARVISEWESISNGNKKLPVYFGYRLISKNEVAIILLNNTKFIKIHSFSRMRLY